MTLYSNNQPIDPIELGGADGGDRIITWFETMNPINKSILSSSNTAPLSIVSNTSILQHVTRENLGIATSDSPNFGGVTITADNYAKLSLLDQDLLTTSNVVFNDIEFDSLALGITVPQSYTKFYSANSVLFESTRYTQTGHDIGPSVLSSNGVSYILSGSIGIGNQNPTKEFDVTGNSAIDSIYERNQRVYSPSNNPPSSEIGLGNVLNVDHVANTGGTFTGNTDFSANLNWGIFDPNSTRSYSIENATYDSVSFSTFSQDELGEGIHFNDDGSKMYIFGDEFDSVYQYILSTPFDLSTASFDVSYDPNVSVPGAIAFGDSGSKMYVADGNIDVINQFTLSTPWDISTASEDPTSFDNSNEEGTVEGIAFSNDGTKMFLAGNNTDSVYQYTLSVAWDVSTASYDSVSFDFSSQETTPRGLVFNSDGSKMYINGISGDPEGVYEYILTTPFDISTVSYSTTFISEGVEGVAFNNDDTKMYIIKSPFGSSDIYQYSIEAQELNDYIGSVVGEGFILDNMVYENISLDVDDQDGSPGAVIFNDNGTRMFIVGLFNDFIHQYSLSKPYDISTAVFSLNYEVTEDNQLRDMAFNGDGTKMYVLGWLNDTIYQYSLSVAYSVEFVTYDSVSFHVGSSDGQDSNPNGFAFSNDGTKMFLVSTFEDRVYQYTLSTAYDLSTASYDSLFFDFASGTFNAWDLAFNNDGTKMFILNDTDDSVYQYSLSTAFDITTASYDSITFDLSSQDDRVRGLAFNDDGTKMYMSAERSTPNGNRGTMYQYRTLSFLQYK